VKVNTPAVAAGFLVVLRASSKEDPQYSDDYHLGDGVVVAHVALVKQLNRVF
jgi:hypothetical protein